MFGFGKLTRTLSLSRKDSKRSFKPGFSSNLKPEYKQPPTMIIGSRDVISVEPVISDRAKKLDSQPKRPPPPPPRVSRTASMAPAPARPQEAPKKQGANVKRFVVAFECEDGEYMVLRCQTVMFTQVVLLMLSGNYAHVESTHKYSHI